MFFWTGGPSARPVRQDLQYMRKFAVSALALTALLSPVLSAAASASQGPSEPAATSTICNQPVGAPRALPPADSGPVVYIIAPCFLKQGGSPIVEAETYMYY